MLGLQSTQQTHVNYMNVLHVLGNLKRGSELSSPDQPLRWTTRVWQAW
jgi:hypothetical protein